MFLQAQTTANTGMELADRAVGFLLSLTSISIFTYYTFWIIILVSSVFHSFGSAYSINLSLVFTLNLVVFQPFVDSDHFVHQYFLPQEYAILVPVFAGMVLLCFLCVFVGFVMLKSKKKKA
jgi:dolichyl-phosphate mannosyltransferase polypeptide 2 regulatory subunit